MNGIKQLKQILADLDRVDEDLALLRPYKSSLELSNGRMIKGGNAALVVAAGVNVLVSRRDNLIERLKTEYNVDIEC